MKTLLLLRHAKSSWKNTYLADHDRPLSGRGKRDAPRMARFLRERDLVPELIVTSTAKRAVTTAEAIAQFSGYQEELAKTRRLYHAWTETYLEIIRELPDRFQRVMLVGHNPGMEELLEVLTGLQERMPTAALAHIELPVRHWNEVDEAGTGELIDVWRPRDIE
jgi:phosphohistidine phosphatase